MKFCAGIVLIICLLAGTSKCQDDMVTLRCLSDMIQVIISDEYLVSSNIDITDGSQLHFNSNPQCFADRIEGGYRLSMFQPYSSCGTSLEHDSDNYIYRNVLVYSPQQITTRALVNISCEYEDKYLVSSNISLTPYVRTLNFATSSGNLAVEMNLFQRSDFHPKSRLGNRPRIVVGVPVYVSVDMVNVFGDSDVVMTLQSCVATTSAEFQTVPTDNHHFLITSRCASPGDTTVRIYSNGVGFTSRFSFQMFKWRSGVEYIYLHCEVLVCNSTEEDCTGSGPLCDGVPTTATRRKRDAPAVQGNTGFMSLGPISMVVLENGRASLESSKEDGETPVVEVTENNEKLLLAYIFGSIAAILLLVGASLFILVLIRKRNRKKKPGISSAGSPHRSHRLPGSH